MAKKNLYFHDAQYAVYQLLLWFFCNSLLGRNNNQDAPLFYWIWQDTSIYIKHLCSHTTKLLHIYLLPSLQKVLLPEHGHPSSSVHLAEPGLEGDRFSAASFSALRDWWGFLSPSPPLFLSLTWLEEMMRRKRSGTGIGRNGVIYKLFKVRSTHGWADGSGCGKRHERFKGSVTLGYQEPSS